MRVCDTRKHIWQTLYHFIDIFKLNLAVILSFALIKPCACTSKSKHFSKLEVVLS